MTKDGGEATPEKAKEDKPEAEKEVGDSHYVDIQLCSIFLCLADTHLDTIASVAQEKTEETKGEKGTETKGVETKTKDETISKDKNSAEPKTNDEPVKEDDVSSYLM